MTIGMSAKKMEAERKESVWYSPPHPRHLPGEEWGRGEQSTHLSGTHAYAQVSRPCPSGSK